MKRKIEAILRSKLSFDPQNSQVGFDKKSGKLCSDNGISGISEAADAIIALFSKPRAPKNKPSQRYPFFSVGDTVKLTSLKHEWPIGEPKFFAKEDNLVIGKKYKVVDTGESIGCVGCIILEGKEWWHNSKNFVKV